MSINNELYPYFSLSLNDANTLDMDTLYQVCDIENSYKSTLTVKRIDTIHPTISGNKYYKLKYNLKFAKEQGFTQILSFGGAYSNHIYAVAHACHECGFDSIGIIRGNELADKPLNKTLTAAKSLGMRLDFVTRQQYRNKSEPEFIAKLKIQYPNAYLIPEGGTNQLAIIGAEEILTDYDRGNFDVICCAVGTGGTISGIINSASHHQLVIGFSVLKSDYQIDSIETWTNTKSLNTISNEKEQSDIIIDNINDIETDGSIKLTKVQSTQWCIIQDDEFGGYGRFNTRLIQFMSDFSTSHDIPLEPVYTGKAMYYLNQALIKSDSNTATALKKRLKEKRVLFIHTGGLQVNL